MVSKSVLLKIGINTLIGVGAIALWLHFVNIQDIITHVRAAHFWYLIPAFLFMLVALVIRAYKLKFFLKPIQDIRLPDIVGLNGVAAMLNFLIPIRAGEVGKAVYLGKTYNISIGKTVVWIFLDRFLDFLFVLIAAPLLLLFIPTHVPWQLLYLLPVLVVSLLVLTYVMIYHSRFATMLFEFFTLFLVFELLKKHFRALYSHFLETFQVLRRSFLDWLVLIGLMVVAYLCDTIVFYFCFLSINSNQNILTIYLGQLLSALTYIIPAAPGYVGSAEFSALSVFTGILGINSDIVSSMSILFHSVVLLFVIMVGVVSVYALDIDLGSLLKKTLNQN